MANFIVTGILILAVWMAVAYIIRAKKNGTKCIGCPSGGTCCSQKRKLYMPYSRITGKKGIEGVRCL